MTFWDILKDVIKPSQLKVEQIVKIELLQSKQVLCIHCNGTGMVQKKLCLWCGGKRVI